MRSLALLLLLAAPAAADDGEEPDYTSFPTLSVGGGVQVHGNELDGAYESGTGAAVELALGSGRWQLVAEGAIASSTRMDETGTLKRAASGLRWLARQFAPADNGSVELFAIATAGVQQYDVAASSATRGELTLGSGFQVRMFRRPRFALRLDARAVFTGGTRTGYLAGFGVAW